MHAWPRDLSPSGWAVQWCAASRSQCWWMMRTKEVNRDWVAPGLHLQHCPPDCAWPRRPQRQADRLAATVLFRVLNCALLYKLRQHIAEPRPRPLWNGHCCTEVASDLESQFTWSRWSSQLVLLKCLWSSMCFLTMVCENVQMTFTNIHCTWSIRMFIRSSYCHIKFERNQFISIKA